MLKHKNELTPEEVEALFEKFIGILRQSEPVAELLPPKRNRHEVRFKGKLFLVKYGLDLGGRGSSRWFFGTMEAHIPDLVCTWAGVILLCVDHDKCRFNVIPLSGLQLAKMLVDGIPYAAGETLPEYKTRDGAVQGISTAIMRGDVERAEMILNAYRSMIGDCSGIERMLNIARKNPSDFRPPKSESKKGEHVNFSVIPKGIGAEIKVGGIETPFPAEWFRDCGAEKAFGRLIKDTP